MTAHAYAESAPRFELPSHRAFVRGAIVLAMCLALLAGFVAHVSYVPAPPANAQPASMQAAAPQPCVPAS
jgi:hypothetical protein